MKLSLVDGPLITVKALAIADGQVSGDGVPSGLALDDLLSIDRDDAMPGAAELGGIVVHFRGGRINARNVTIANEKCKLRWWSEQEIELPLDAVYWIRLVDGPIPDFDKAASVPAADKDRVLVRGEDGAVSVVSGIVESLSDEHVVIELGGQQRMVPRNRVVGILIAQAAVAEPAQPLTVSVSDGSWLSGDGLSVNDDKASLTLPGDNRLAFPWTKVDRVCVRSSRVAYLADLKPVDELQRPIVTPGYPAQRGLSAAGGPLRLGSQGYESGLGVHARSEITFSANGVWDVFVATIGLDPERGKQGDCVFKVIGDGKELFSKRCRGSDLPREIKVPIAGFQRVTLLVEPGEDLDLGDHANWCNARFVISNQ